MDSPKCRACGTPLWTFQAVFCSKCWQKVHDANKRPVEPKR